MDKPSLLIVSIGANFMPGVKEAITEAGNFYGQDGAKWRLDVQHSLTVIPPMGLSSMRNFQIRRAYLEGFDFLAIIDNDVKVEAETFAKLTAHGLDYVVPWFDQSPTGKVSRLQDPMYDKDQGLQELNWTVPYLNILNIHTITEKVGFSPFDSLPIYSEDEMNSLHFRCRGVTIWQDTDTHVLLLRPPGLLCDNFLKDGKLAVVLPHGGP